MSESPPTLRVFYAAGPGDVIATFRDWAQGEHDQASVVVAYSQQFFEACRHLGAKAYVLAARAEGRRLEEGPFIFRERAIPGLGRRGVRYYLGQLYNAGDTMVRAVRFRSDVVVVSSGQLYFLLSPLALAGIPVVPSLHNTFWPEGFPPTSRKARFLNRLQGWYWRHFPPATICVSKEISRQLAEMAHTPTGDIRVVFPQYERGYLETLPPPLPATERPFRVMYAGRVEREKGVFEVLELCRRLEIRSPGEYVWSVCGDGSALEELRARVVELGLEGIFELRGALGHEAMAEAYAWSQVVMVPTTREFAEGRNKVVVEGVLAGRPVIASTVCCGQEAVQDAAIYVSPSDLEAYQAALLELSCDAEAYERRRQAAVVAREGFFDATRGWGAALESILRGIAEAGEAEA